MPAISVERKIGETKKAVLAGLVHHNTQKMGKQKYKRFAISLRDDDGTIVGGIVGEVWMTVLFIQFFWIDEQYRGDDHGRGLITELERQAKNFGAVRSYVDTMSVQAPGFYASCGYEEYGAIDGYPGGVTRHWLTKGL